MKVYRNFDEIDHDPNTVLTVGTFDGVHLGHQKIINRLLNISKDEKLRNVLVTMHPHPQIVLHTKDKSHIKLISTIEERLYLFEKYDLENVLVIPFSYEFSQVTGEEFIREYLYKQIGLKKILIGYDHMFGKNRSGNIELLKNLSNELNFDIERIDAFSGKNEVISSTKIRNALSENNIKEANEMLGHPFLISGEVVHGQGRAAQLGYPTANFNNFNPNKVIPGRGVYLVRSNIHGKCTYGMANIGVRPTLTNDTELTLEVNYFDFNCDIYGQIISVEFLDFLRKEVKFPSVDDLLEQITKDKKKCQELLKEYTD
jgi:riboflavin kinase/FMN adenylyltransferase